MDKAASPRVGRFIATKEHRRFIEFANAVRKHRYIGLCFGAAGVGKTLSAQRYTNWNFADFEDVNWSSRKGAAAESKLYAAVAKSRTLFYTPSVGVSAGFLRRDLQALLSRANDCIYLHLTRDRKRRSSEETRDRMEMVIVDESERLSTPALDYLRDLFDRSGIGLLFVGMPGMEKRMARYPQLYSRVGFAHHYRPLQGDELSFVLTHHWRKLGLNLDTTDFSDTQAIASIARITGGNFRLLHRLFVQIERILKINELTVITDEVVSAARSTLVIGAA